MGVIEPWMLEAVRACGPDDGPLRGLVVEAMRREPDVVREIAEAEDDFAKRSQKTMESFALSGQWPTRGRGLVSETASLARWAYWMPGEKAASWDSAFRGLDGRPDRRLTLRCVVACYLLGDLESDSSFGSGCDEPDDATCLILADGVTRLGDGWSVAALRWFAWVVVRTWAPDEGDAARADLYEAGVGLLFVISLLAARENALNGGDYPVADLIRCIKAIDREDLRGLLDFDPDNERVNVPLVRGMTYLRDPRDPLRMSEALLVPIVEELSGGDRDEVNWLIRCLRTEAKAAARLSRAQQERTEQMLVDAASRGWAWLVGAAVVGTIRALPRAAAEGLPAVGRLVRGPERRSRRRPRGDHTPG